MVSEIRLGSARGRAVAKRPSRSVEAHVRAPIVLEPQCCSTAYSLGVDEASTVET
jgi:hypothetical protein